MRYLIIEEYSLTNIEKIQREIEVDKSIRLFRMPLDTPKVRSKYESLVQEQKQIKGIK